MISTAITALSFADRERTSCELETVLQLVRRDACIAQPLGVKSAPLITLQIAAFSQSGDCFAHHSITEVPLAHAQQLGPTPCLVDRLDFSRGNDGIEFA